MLKFFAEKMWVATHIVSSKNIRILYIESAKTLNEMTVNELVKLTTLWTTGPWSRVGEWGFYRYTKQNQTIVCCSCDNRFKS